MRPHRFTTKPRRRAHTVAAASSAHEVDPLVEGGPNGPINAGRSGGALGPGELHVGAKPHRQRFPSPAQAA